VSASVSEVTNARGHRRVVATIIARNYLAFARVLQDSVAATNPDVDRVTLLVDGTEEDRATTGVGRIVLPGDLGLAPEEFEPMAVMYTVMELSTALKPALLRHLLGDGYDVAAYLDPDVLVKGDLADAFAAAHEHAIALTPHVLDPVPLDGLEIAERTVMQAGVFNLGFIAVGSRAVAFLNWWHTRLTTHAVVDFSAGLFTDQRWVDWVPALFEHTVLRGRGLNVAYWNAHERPLTMDEDGTFFAAGDPLVFIHFSGFNPATPWMLSRFTGRKPRALVSESPALAQLCLEYGGLLERAGYEDGRLVAYGFDDVGGVAPLTSAMRTAYRGALLGDLPFMRPPLRPLTTPGVLREWFGSPARLTPWFSLTPAEYAHWLSSPDLRASAPHPLTHSVCEVRARLAASPGAGSEGLVSLARGPDASFLTSGWVILAGGSTEPAGEVAEVAQRLATALAASGIDVDLLELGARSQGGAVRWDSATGRSGAMCQNLLVCVDANRIIEAELAQQLEGCPGLRVGVWLTSNPSEIEAHSHFLEAFDEVWIVSAALEEPIRAASSVRVAMVPVPVPVGVGGETGEPDPGGGLRFLLELDALAPIARQGVEVAIGAYLAAFHETQGHQLLVRPRYGQLPPSDVELLRHLCGGRADVRIVDDSFSPGLADVVLALNPLADTGLSALEALSAGATVVTGTPGVSALVGIDAGVACVSSNQGSRPEVDAVAAALSALAAGGPRSHLERTLAARGADPATLLAAALQAGPRPYRNELVHHNGLEGEVATLRKGTAHLTAELAALEATKVFRYTRVLRSAYRLVSRRGR